MSLLSGYFTVDVTFYYRVIADATLSAGRTNTVTGLAVFSSGWCCSAARPAPGSSRARTIDVLLQKSLQSARCRGPLPRRSTRSSSARA
ncbi:MAG: hypothetical protein ACLT1T_11250 [Oscillospiraceae bacterium]